MGVERQKATSSEGSGVLLVPVLSRNPYGDLSGSQTQGSFPVGSPHWLVALSKTVRSLPTALFPPP